jgi:hypothetical protein
VRLAPQIIPGRLFVRVVEVGEEVSRASPLVQEGLSVQVQSRHAPQMPAQGRLTVRVLEEQS